MIGIRMKQKLIIIGLTTIGLAGIVLFAPQVSALECSVLPQAICDAADSGGGDVSDTGVWKLLIWVLNIMMALVSRSIVLLLMRLKDKKIAKRGKSCKHNTSKLCTQHIDISQKERDISRCQRALRWYQHNFFRHIY